MKLKQYQVDAFATHVFEGNPAAICPLESWLDDALLQSIAQENNLSETAFFVEQGSGFELRWFTPTDEVDLCGHATLAAAHVIFNHLGFTDPTILFTTRSGQLHVTQHHNFLHMDFPLLEPIPCDTPENLLLGLNTKPEKVLAHDDYLVIYTNQAAIQNLQPNPMLLSQIDRRGVIVTAPGDDVDFVSRFFAPKLGINEDPVTGSAHCLLAHYWSNQLGKNTLKAHQLSHRGGFVNCEVHGARVTLSGTAITFMEAIIEF